MALKNVRSRVRKTVISAFALPVFIENAYATRATSELLVIHVGTRMSSVRNTILHICIRALLRV